MQTTAGKWITRPPNRCPNGHRQARIKFSSVTSPASATAAAVTRMRCGRPFLHDKVLRTAIEAHGGFVFSHIGDGVVAAFASPMSAVNAAIDAQRELQLPVRMGIATGEAELREGDYFGTVLNRAARVMAAGHGGQILVADSTAVLVRGVDLLDLGPRPLRDLPSGDVAWPGLGIDFGSYMAGSDHTGDRLVRQWPR
jgi:Adenylate and Guanylate cyclase catalytic domain